jgi:hypothetical protein
MSEIQIASDYRAGLIRRVTHMHMAYYAPFTGFGQRFESVVAGGLASFCDRLHHPNNQIWLAIQDLQFVDAKGFEETQLWTFNGLHAARHLYESNGFKLAEENLGNQWGTEILEQRFCRAPKRS